MDIFCLSGGDSSNSQFCFYNIISVTQHNTIADPQLLLYIQREQYFLRQGFSASESQKLCFENVLGTLILD